MDQDEKKDEKKYTPILPFDITTGEDHYMYDHPVYVRDITLFDNNERMMNRGNVISIFNCKMVPPCKVGGDIPPDDVETDVETVETAEIESE